MSNYPNAYPDGMTLRQIRQMEGDDPGHDEEPNEKIMVTGDSDGNHIMWVMIDGEEHGIALTSGEAIQLAKDLT